MANGVLLISSVVFGALHVLAVTWFQAPWRLEALLVLGVLTSILNHGTTSELAKWGDRVLISLCAVNDATFLLHLPRMPERIVAGGTLLAAITCYFMAKFRRECVRTRDVLHSGCHCLATIGHWMMLSKLTAAT